MTEEQYIKLDQIHNNIEQVEIAVENLFDLLSDSLGAIKKAQFNEFEQFAKLTKSLGAALDICSKDNCYKEKIDTLNKLEGKLKKCKKKKVKKKSSAKRNKISKR